MLPNFEIQTVSNGFIFKTDDAVYVFKDVSEITDWFQTAYPSKKNLVRFNILHPNPEKMIATIRVIRKHTDLGLRESKDIADRARNKGRAFIAEITKEQAEKFADDLLREANTESMID